MITLTEMKSDLLKIENLKMKVAKDLRIFTEKKLKDVQQELKELGFVAIKLTFDYSYNVEMGMIIVEVAKEKNSFGKFDYTKIDVLLSNKADREKLIKLKDLVDFVSDITKNQEMIRLFADLDRHGYIELTL